MCWYSLNLYTCDTKEDRQAFYGQLRDSIDSIKKFAGAKPELAKYYPEDDNFLLEKEKHISLYEVFYEK